MTKLNPTQRDLLNSAANADGGIVEPPPRAAYKPLIRLGLFIAMPTSQGGVRLLLTEAGRQEVAAQSQESAITEPAAKRRRPPAAPKATEPPLSAPEVKGKLGILVGLLQAPQGASIGVLTAATGWQAHSVRGAIAGSLKKKLKLNVTSLKTDGLRVYRIVEPASL